MAKGIGYKKKKGNKEAKVKREMVIQSQMERKEMKEFEMNCCKKGETQEESKRSKGSE